MNRDEWSEKKYFIPLFVLLTVRLGTIFVNNQGDAKLFFIYVPTLV
jgi:hypothetical protein